MHLLDTERFTQLLLAILREDNSGNTIGSEQIDGTVASQLLT
jgi:hypothetical protein